MKMVGWLVKTLWNNCRNSLLSLNATKEVAKEQERLGEFQNRNLFSWAQSTFLHFRFYLKTETESSLRNVVF
jgi:hypothetical protein